MRSPSASTVVHPRGAATSSRFTRAPTPGRGVSEVVACGRGDATPGLGLAWHRREVPSGDSLGSSSSGDPIGRIPGSSVPSSTRSAVVPGGSADGLVRRIPHRSGSADQPQQARSWHPRSGSGPCRGSGLAFDLRRKAARPRQDQHRVVFPESICSTSMWGRRRLLGGPYAVGGTQDLTPRALSFA